jgi:hypothetical protein
MFIKVKEGHEAVIYRLGRFHRLAGPGPAWLWPYVDELHATLDVRQTKLTVLIRTFAGGGMPVTLRLSFHARLDLRRAAGQDFGRLAELASWDEEERKEKLDDAVQHLVIRMVREYERRHPVPHDADFLTQLAHILTMTRQNDALMVNIRRHLGRVIARSGYILSQAEPCWMVLDSLPPTLIEAFDRTRTDRVHMQRLTAKWEQLLRLIRDYPPHLQAHLMAVIEGLQPPPLQIPGHEGSLELNTRLTPNGKAEVEIGLRPPGPNQPSSAHTAGAQMNAEEDPDPPLTMDDVALVRVVPPRRQQAA